MTEIRTVIVGTAGHIDHGKSSLVEALTGIDPDRLEEERRRGMTIDLGFARYEHGSGSLVGIIDVPGHERFIKNMVAGATSVDVVLLVVAADDGVMPQTREHLQILELLGVSRGLVALTKIDLVGEELAELAAEDVRDFVRGTFLEGQPLVPTSVVTGAGLDALRTSLDELVSDVEPHGAEGPFRLPVQRVFSAKGHGTVVTGVPVSGAVSVGDELEVVDTGARVRVRGVQAYGATRDAGTAGHSTALNVSGVAKDEVHRGCVVATPGVYRARRRVLVSYRHVHPDMVLRNNHPVRLHVGTSEVMGRAVVLDGDVVEGTEPAWLQLRLDEPVVAAAGDRYLLREAASLAVLGGGAVLASSDGRLKRFKPRVLDEAQRRLEAQGDASSQARVALELAGRRGCDLSHVVLETQLPAQGARALLADLVQAEAAVPSGSLWFDAGVLEEVGDDLERLLEAEHRAQPLLEWSDLKRLRQGIDLDEDLLQATLAGDGRFETAPGGRVRLAGHSVRLTEEQLAARARILDMLKRAGAQPAPVEGAAVGLPEAEAATLLEGLTAAGEIVSIGGLHYHAEVVADMEGIVVEHGRARSGEIEIPSLRDELGTTRKYLIPILEHFDTVGVTVRRGDRRVLRPRV